MYEQFAKEAEEVCPVCAQPKSYFEIKAENYSNNGYYSHYLNI